MDEKIFNRAFDMTMEWGENFHKPIQERLMAEFPEVTQAEADEFDRLCREIMYYGFSQVELAYTKQIPDSEASANILARYPLLNSDSMASIWSQGQYYAWHDNG